MQKNCGQIISMKPRLCLVHLLDEDAFTDAFGGVVNYTAACLLANRVNWNKTRSFHLPPELWFFCFYQLCTGRSHTSTAGWCGRIVWDASEIKAGSGNGKEHIKEKVIPDKRKITPLAKLET